MSPILRPLAILAFACLAPVAPRLAAAPTHLVDQAPVAITTPAAGVILVDFGRAAYGNLQLLAPASATGTITVHFGESLVDGRINRKPPGTVRYATAKVTLGAGGPLVVAPPADMRNTTAPAVLTPPEWGVVLPFRWVEVEGWTGELKPAQIVRRAAFATTWNDQAAAFQCSDEMLNRIWELCRYSIKATTFAGVYVDGDRERIAYEADAYLNQLSHYASDPDPQMARDTFDRLIAFPTWPTEWAPHVVFMAYADWRQTGDTAWLAPRYEALKAKLLTERARADGLLVSTDAQIKRGDIVDWPVGERDGFVFKPVNTVVNAFHLRALAAMAELARALHRDDEAAAYEARAKSTRAAFQEKLFDPARGLYRDGEGTDHASLHANLFPLAFGLVPEASRPAVAQWLGGRGMACSVYAAQYLMEGLFENGAATTALALMTAGNDRSWRHMVESGTTITWEAWDQHYKPNQDWNHAWGAAPANLLPRYVLGAQPISPGWKTILLRPQPGALSSATGKIPTPAGPVEIAWKQEKTFSYVFRVPPGTSARIDLPAGAGSSLWVDGRRAASTQTGDRLVLTGELTGKHTVEVR